MSLQRRVAKLEASTGIGGPHGEALRPLLRLTGWPDERPIPDDCTLDMDSLFAAVAASPASSPMARLRAAQSMASAS